MFFHTLFCSPTDTHIEASNHVQLGFKFLTTCKQGSFHQPKSTRCFWVSGTQYKLPNCSWNRHSSAFLWNLILRCWSYSSKLARNFSLPVLCHRKTAALWHNRGQLYSSHTCLLFYKGQPVLIGITKNQSKTRVGPIWEQAKSTH